MRPSLMPSSIARIAVGLAVGCLLSAGAASADDSPKVFGWVEKAELKPWDIMVKAKLDSGALTSSLDARDIERFEKDGDDWVRFRFEMEDEDTGEEASEDVERPLYRILTVRGAGGRDERPVVLLNLCVGDTVYEEQFSLRNRGKMNYPVLLGRRTISHLGHLDVRETFENDANCGEDAEFVEHEPEDD
ncbi:ATP-dependent zinc protease [Vreelandella subglaciescola]|uniref:Uncharacterized conserved protein n=1 Tax=Vreelandella subglaciescola TaxID=29571 RepID=A0A1M7FMB9_9GAMM|nr:RimK/LysX family protein [Halomonas subglaciescola]SHM05211.1 Uncharacterized conserved protein [Halomonas subglaciescola]